MCVQGKIPLGTSLGQMGKHLHKGAVKPGPGFLERPLPVPLDRCNSGSGDEIVVLRNRE